MNNYVTEILKYNQCETVIGSTLTHDICSYRLTLHAVCYIAFTQIRNFCSSDVRQLWTPLTVVDTRKNVHITPLYLGTEGL